MYFVNRQDSGTLAARIVTFGGTVQLIGANGSVVNAASITSSQSVTTLTFSTPSPAATPNPALPVQLSPTARLLSARFVRINASTAACLHFKEIFVFDVTNTNVAFGRNTTGGPQNSSRTTAMAVNGVIDFDNALPNADMTCSAACDGSGWWTVDLGGVFNVSTIIMWNRYLAATPSLAATV